MNVPKMITKEDEEIRKHNQEIQAMMLFIYFYQKISIFIHFQLLLLFYSVQHIHFLLIRIVQTNKNVLYLRRDFDTPACLPLRLIQMRMILSQLFVSSYLFYFSSFFLCICFFIQEEHNNNDNRFDVIIKIKCIAFQSFTQQWDMEILRVDLNILFISFFLCLKKKRTKYQRVSLSKMEFFSDSDRIRNELRKTTRRLHSHINMILNIDKYSQILSYFIIIFKY